MSGHNITKTYLRLRIIPALTPIILAAVFAHLAGHAYEEKIVEKAAVTAALDKAQLSATEIIISLRELASTGDRQRAGPFRAEIRRADRELRAAYDNIALFIEQGWLGAETMALLEDPLLDPLSLIQDVSMVAKPLFVYSGPYGDKASAHISVGLSLSQQILPVLARIKETEGQGLKLATQDLHYWSNIALYATIFLVLTTGMVVFLPLEKSILKAQSEVKAQRNAAQAASRAKSEFLATMSHEIRTPMNGVLGMAALLQKSNLDERQAKFANIIVSSGNALLAIINDILDFSSIEAGKLEMEIAPFNIETSCSEVIELLRPQAGEKGLNIAFENTGSQPGPLLGDEGRIRQIIINLVGNAIKFTQEGSVTLSVCAGKVQGGHVPLSIAVTDTGIGIAEDKMQRIFESFEQADNSMKRSFDGTGLGLAITRSLVRAFGGTISAVSREGEGSTFTVEVTLAADTETAGADAVLNIANPDTSALRDMLAAASDQTAPPGSKTKAA
jgi:signal transduction histidine kinase